MARDRTGMTVRADGGPRSEKPLGLWTAALDGYGPDSFVGRSGLVYDQLAQTGMRLHNLNRSVITARAQGKPATLPEPEARLAFARSEQKRVAALAERLDTIEGDLTAWKAKTLQPYDYSKSTTSPASTFPGRAELRQTFARLDANGKRAALQNEKFRAAILEQPGQVSGMSDTDWNGLMQLELEARFPVELQAVADSTAAIEAARTNLQTVSSAIANELASIGQPLREEEAPPPRNTWAA
jgi:hypothetical protein